TNPTNHGAFGPLARTRKSRTAAPLNRTPVVLFLSQLDSGGRIMTIVVPVRLAARDRVTQTTSRELTPASVLVASQQPPWPEELMSLRLYLPDAGSPAGLWGKVREANNPGEFWLDLLEVGWSVRAGIAALLARR